MRYEPLNLEISSRNVASQQLMSQSNPTLNAHIVAASAPPTPTFEYKYTPVIVMLPTVSSD